MTRKNFAFRFEWQQAIAHLDPMCRLEIIEATIRYAATGELGNISEVALEAFNAFILPDFIRRQKAAEARARAKARKSAMTENSAPTVEKAPEVKEVQSASTITPDSPSSRPISSPSFPALLNRSERRRLEQEQKRMKKRMRHHQAG